MGLSVKVAVIGAGVAGLVAARELKREGHQVVLFEKANQFGGTWLYDPQVESDPLSLDPARKIIHSSLYYSLRANLPRQIFSFSDYPFTVREGGDPRTFPSHQEVLRFLVDFAKEFGIVDLTRFGTEVVRVEEVEENEWVVESRQVESGLMVVDLFEAVVICNGHNTEPMLAYIPGIERWHGKQVHSHNYRHSTPYENQVVIIIRNGPSAIDISREISKVAKEVHLSSRSPDIVVSKLENCPNIWQHSMINKVCEDGMIQFDEGIHMSADIILHCTGYNYNFPFLHTNGAVSIEDKRVGPLYKHVFPPSLAPRLSFVGIPNRAIVTFIFELQSKWIARVLSGKVNLPSKEEMLADVEQYYQSMQEYGIPKHHTHTLDVYKHEYGDWLASQVGVPPIKERVKSLYTQTLENYRSHMETYREVFEPAETRTEQ